VVIPNAPDPEIFHAPSEPTSRVGRRLRVIASSWSANPRKGAEILEWIDGHLDHDRFEVTFVGQTSARLSKIRVIAPLGSEALAEVLRNQDVYLAASRDDPCSNALLEGLACGLPAAYLRSGGHPELVQDGGIGFDEPEELPETLERLDEELEMRRRAISVPLLGEVAQRYLEVLRP
jgi:glycosyltransferase involved in cell wall biosynthesis